MKQTLLSFLLALLPIVASAEAVEINGLYYELNKEAHKAAVISNPYVYKGDIIIPAEIECDGITYVVNEISAMAFMNCFELASLTIPNTITTIGGAAVFSFNEEDYPIINVYISDLEAWCRINCPNRFDYPPFLAHRLYLNGEQITNLKIPNNIESIDTYAFCNTIGIDRLFIPKSVKSIGDDAFYGVSGLSNIVVESGNIVYDSRDNCNAIIETASNTLLLASDNTTIPNGVVSIWEGAFYGCSGLKSLFIPSSLTNIGTYIFSECKSLNSIIVDSKNPIYDSRDNCNAIIESVTNKLVVGCNYTTIPASVIKIGAYALASRTGLTSITIPSSITYIDERAFYNCCNLKEVVSEVLNPFPISDDVFFGISPEAELVVQAGAYGKYLTVNGWAKNFTHIRFEDGNSSIITFADNTVKKICIDNWDFNRDGELSEVEAASVTSLGSVFNGNLNIKSFDELYYFKGLTRIENQTFTNCKNLSSLTIPDEVTIIEHNAFYGCSSLTSIAIPKSVTTISPLAFHGCSGLSSITVESGNLTYDSRNDCNAIIETENNTLLRGCKNTFFPASVTAIGYSAFSGCSSLTSLIIPESITFINGNAYDGCHLENIIAKNSCIKFDGKAFSTATYNHAMLYIPVGKWTEAVYESDWYQFHNIRETAMEVEELSRETAYTLMEMDTYSYVVYDATNNKAETASHHSVDESNPYHCWQVVDLEGLNCLYNIGARKFAHFDSNGSMELVDRPQPIAMKNLANGIGLDNGNKKQWGLVVSKNRSIDHSVTIVSSIHQNETKQSAWYGLDGQRMSIATKGVNIVRMEDGTVRKYIIK